MKYFAPLMFCKFTNVPLIYFQIQIRCLANSRLLIDLSNGVGVEVGIGIGLGLRNIIEGCFKTTKVNKYKSRTVYRAVLGYGI